MLDPERDQKVEAFLQQILAKSASLRLPELFKAPQGRALYYLPDRNGVSVVALRTTDLSQDQLVKILTYRLTQYLSAGQLDPHLIFETRLEHEPISAVSERDIHFLTGDSESGEILCYMTFEGVDVESRSTTLRTHDRPLFPVEQVFGQHVFSRLRILPDLPCERIRELGRFAKNHQRPPLDELTARGAVELEVAVLRSLSGPLRTEIDACIGDLEEGVVKKRLDYFHVPTVVIHGVVPYAAEGSYGFHNYQQRTRYPFAYLSSDISTARLDAVDRALELPGSRGLVELMNLKEQRSMVRSSLEPTGGLGPLTDAALPQQGVTMKVRRELRDLGEWLRTTEAFASLSSAEASVLAKLLERRTAAAGDLVIRSGDAGEEMFLVESGRAEVRGVDGRPLTTLGPGSHFGEIALLEGGERTADVVALEPMSLLRLSREAYVQYLSRVAEVDHQLTRSALAALQRSREARGPTDWRLALHNPVGNLIISAIVVLAPLTGAPERLAHPAPWLALTAAWLTFATQPQLGPRRMVTDKSDRLSPLAILAALVAGLVISVVDFGYRSALHPLVESALLVTGALVAESALLLRIWSIHTLGRFFTATVRVTSDQQVIDSGPYRWLRHPSYTGALFTTLGLAMAFGSAIGAVATLALGIPAYIYRMKIEERALVAELGDAYRAYSERTWRLLPWIY